MGVSQYDDLKDITKVHARYIEEYISEDNNNRLVAALPKVRTADECIEELINFPAIPKLEGASDEEKILKMKYVLGKIRFGNTYIASLDLEIASLLRTSYQNKKMYDISRIRDSYYDNLRQEAEYIYKTKYTEEMNGITVCGVSGGGKSTVVNEVLKHIPQAILHDGGNFIQITYIKVNCPANRSLGSFYESCIAEMERVVERKLIDKPNKLKNVKDKGDFFKTQANRFTLGILVIDEIQNLALDKDMSLSQLLELSNEINCPLVLIGTYKAIKFIEKKNFCVLRRSGMRIMVDPLSNDETWEIIIKSLWKYQWSNEHATLTREIIDTLYEHTGGIFGCLLNLYKAIMMDSIYTGKIVTPDYIVDIVKRYFPYLEDIATRLKNNDEKVGWDDVYKSLLRDVLTVEDKMKEKSVKKISAKFMNTEIDIMNNVVNIVSLSTDELCDFENVEKLYNRFYKENIEGFRSAAPNKRIHLLIRYIYNTTDNQSVTSLNTTISEGRKKRIKKDGNQIFLPRLDMDNPI